MFKLLIILFIMKLYARNDIFKISKQNFTLHKNEVCHGGLFLVNVNKSEILNGILHFFAVSVVFVSVLRY